MSIRHDTSTGLNAVGTFLAAIALLFQSLFPLVSDVLQTAPGSAGTILCTAEGPRAIAVDSEGRPIEAPDDPGGHEPGSLDCLLCCGRIVEAALVPSPWVLQVAWTSFEQEIATVRLASGHVRMVWKAPRGPPAV